MSASTYGEGFAQVYDRAGFSAFSERMIPYLDQNLERLNLQPQSILDLACGTGTAAILLAQRGFKVYGVDRSEEMLEIARKKSAKERVQVEFVLSDIRNFVLPEKVDLAISLYDSLNYILEREELVSVFGRVKRYLKENGLFMFDMNTLYKIKYGWDNSFRVFWITHDILVIEGNAYDQESNTTTKNFAFFVKKKDELFERVLEEHTERGYTIDEIERGVEDSGLQFIDCYECFTFKQPQSNTGRIFYICRNTV
ncbi:methyltransferase domain-containing protein [Candidatus Bathyarchaeota archaeon]|nr:class I SAM-dependent methyltransferase [Candidatus Bathyarchaeota archaeon]NIR15511.1 class I SAM-dependent methyltransferase [Desulfobacterales bacterium]NIU80726.1 methyltransferase domain-containing protein [Candidatus Bathyarchaeota archaeon]NIV67351.1 methyltransferase domain-containing protein [Candidatus Bathyarchaeota archaeon]NIW15898.1 methyltransferase domain-containing protein [Candidatus Bathyarchaeota archaeon]